MFFLLENILGKKGEIKFTDKECTVQVPDPHYGKKDHGAKIIVDENGKKVCSANDKHVILEKEKCPICGANIIVNLEIKPPEPPEKFCSENAKHVISPKG